MITKEINNTNGLHLAFIGREMVLRNDGSALDFNDIVNIQASMPCDELFAEPEYGICVLGIMRKDADGNETASLLPPEYKTIAIRLYNAEQQEDTIIRISRAKGLLEWLRDTKYCSHCGAPLRPHATQTAMECQNCGKLTFPRIEPCIIVLVRRDNKILLAKHSQRNQDIYACIAGFMETGETAEQAVKREIMEETGLTVKNIRYFGTQSWPFPAQMMIGFTAEYESGEIKIQESEIQDAAWFTMDNCPATPKPGSIAYQMIHSFLKNEKSDKSKPKL